MKICHVHFLISQWGVCGTTRRMMQSTKFRMHARKLRVLRDTREDRPWHMNNGPVCKTNAAAIGSTAECISKMDEAFRAYNIRRHAIVAANGELSGRGRQEEGDRSGISTYISAYASTRRASPAPLALELVLERQRARSHRACGERSVPSHRI